MWRASLFRRIGFLIVVSLAAAAVGFIRIGVPPDGGFERAQHNDDLEDVAIRKNLSKHLLSRDRLEVRPEDLRIHWNVPSHFQIGHQGQLWFVSQPKQSQKNDVYFGQFTVSSAGIPFNLTQPFNLTRTPLSDEWIVASARDRVFFCHDKNVAGVKCTLLEFDRPRSQVEGTIDHLIDWLNQHLEYGHLGRPRLTRFEVHSPDGLRGAQFSRTSLRLTDATGTVEFSLGKRVVAVTCDSPDAAESCLSADELGQRIRVVTPERGRRDASERLIDALAQNPLMGIDRIVAIRAYVAKSRAWVQDKLDRWLEPAPVETARPRLQTAVPAQLWPPSRVTPLRPVGLPGEGEWVPHAIDMERENADTLITYVRPAKGPPGARVWLYAFDMRRLGLDYVAGTVSPRTMTANLGRGEVPASRQTDLVAAFNAAPLFVRGEAGAKSDGDVLVPPVDGLATVAINHEGKAELGIWDAGASTSPWRSLRQSMSPLIASGLILPDVGSAWGGAYSPLARTPFTRSALGVTELGVLIYAWSSSVDAQSIALVLRQAGARFAMHLGLGQRGTGVEFIRSDDRQFRVKKGNPRMGFSRNNWSHGAHNGFFYLFRTGRLASYLRRPTDLRLDGVPWTQDLLVDGVPVVAHHEFGENSPTMGGPVSLVLMDPEKLRPHFVPGLLERRADSVDARAKLVLPSVPRVSVAIGVREKKGAYGLTVERRVWRPAKKGLMSFAVDADGLVRIGRFDEGLITSRIRWSTLVQGPALVSNTHLTPDANGVTGLPSVAAGLNQAGLLVLAISKDGDRKLMGSSLAKAGVINGLLLGERSTVDTGVFRSYGQREGQLTMKEDFRPKLLKAVTVPGASSSLFWTDRWPAHAAGATATFVRMRVSRP